MTTVYPESKHIPNQTGTLVLVNNAYNDYSVVLRKQTAISVLLGVIIECASAQQRDRSMSDIIGKNICVIFPATRDNQKKRVFELVVDLINAILKLGMLSDTDNNLNIAIAIKNVFDTHTLDDIVLEERWKAEIFNLLFQGKTNTIIIKTKPQLTKELYYCTIIWEIVKKYLEEYEKAQKPKSKDDPRERDPCHAYNIDAEY
jgi:hypothetical protein